MFGAPPAAASNDDEVGTREISWSEAGTKISFATSHHDEFAAQNIVDKDASRPWMTGGLFPQTLILSFPDLMNVKEVTLKSYNVKDVILEKSSSGLRTSDFEVVTTDKTLDETKGTAQKENLANYNFSALHLKLTIQSGYDHFCAVYRLSVIGGFASKSVGLFHNPSQTEGLFKFGGGRQPQPAQEGQNNQFSFGNSALFAAPEPAQKPSLFFGQQRQLENQNEADDESDDNTAPAHPQPQGTSEPFVVNTQPFKQLDKPKLVSTSGVTDNQNPSNFDTETPTREAESESDNDNVNTEKEDQLWNALGGLDAQQDVPKGNQSPLATLSSPEPPGPVPGVPAQPANYFTPNDDRDKNKNLVDDSEEGVAAGAEAAEEDGQSPTAPAKDNEGKSGYNSDDVSSTGEMKFQPNSPESSEGKAAGNFGSPTNRNMTSDHDEDQHDEEDNVLPF